LQLQIQEFFDALGLREKETLNGVAKAGSCQFSCLADQLFGKECTREWRADIYLRRLALHVIAANEVGGAAGAGLGVRGGADPRGCAC
jgi:hypothetical protein